MDTPDLNVPNFQPTLQKGGFRFRALKESDFEKLYEAASDPLVWEQHPNKNRYQRKEFENFFQGALKSVGAGIIEEISTGEVAGSSRFYDYDKEKDEVFIGYTFYARKYWGKGVNAAIKDLMIRHAFLYVSRIKFHVGSENYRSIKAMEKLGAKEIGRLMVAYFGESPKENIEFLIEKKDYLPDFKG